MVLTVVRHGQTDFNTVGRYTGSTDVPLNETGLRQAEKLAEGLRGRQFDLVVSSSLLRARQTAEIICSVLQTTFLQSEAFAERNVGVFEGLTREEAQQKYPALWAENCTRLLDGAPINGETIRQFDERITAGIQSLFCDYPNAHVLLICHAGVSRFINRYCKGMSFDDMHGFTLENCGTAEYILTEMSEQPVCL